MKRILSAMAAATVVALLALNSSAEMPSTFKTHDADWRYVWNGGQWWYWTAQNSWLVWSGSAWVPYGQPNRAAPATVDQLGPYSTGYGSYEAQDANAASQPAYSGSDVYSPSYSWGSAGNYAGYGWTWGPGTAFRDAPPGRRF